MRDTSIDLFLVVEHSEISGKMQEKELLPAKAAQDLGSMVPPNRVLGKILDTASQVRKTGRGISAAFQITGESSPLIRLLQIQEEFHYTLTRRDSAE